MAVIKTDSRRDEAAVQAAPAGHSVFWRAVLVAAAFFWWLVVYRVSTQAQAQNLFEMSLKWRVVGLSSVAVGMLLAGTAAAALAPGGQFCSGAFAVSLPFW